jgi:hypothetical protein
MKTRLTALTALILALVGCAGPWHRVPTRPDTRQSNAREYDAFVEQRKRELAAGGQEAGRASAIANAEAARRFGERIDAGSTNSASWTWTDGTSRDLTLAELDKTVDAMKKK